MSNDYTRNAIVQFLDESPSIEGKTVIDYGCGDGWGSMEMKRNGAMVTACDTDSDAGGLLIDIKLYRPNSIYSEGHFDIVFCHHVLEHIYDPVEFLFSLESLMHDNSELWLSVPNFTVNRTYCLGHIIPYTMPVLIEHLRQARYDTANGSYKATHPDFGHLRVRIRPYVETGLSDYPEPMNREMRERDRCDTKDLMNINWD